MTAIVIGKTSLFHVTYNKEAHASVDNRKMTVAEDFLC